MRNGREVRGAGHSPPARSRLPRRRDQLDIRLYRAYAYVLGVLLCGYLFLDRGFSHFHFPKLKVVFLGEMTLLLGAIAVLVGTRWLGLADADRQVAQPPGRDPRRASQADHLVATPSYI